ncbi:MAG: hypothetical protein RXS42_00490 [Nitrososphaeria archaeon]
MPLIFTVPRAFWRLPELGLRRRMPPFGTLTLTTTIPCLAL